MLISEALGLKEKAFISLVGAGGKSALLKRLAEELILKEKKIILSTTTKMFTWQLAPFIKNDKLLKCHNEETVLQSIKKHFSLKSKRGRLAVIGEEMEDNNGEEKLSGPPPEWLDKWWEEKIADYFLIEADGAAGRPVKAPASHEPVIPLSTTDLVGVIGIDALGLSLQEENVFRSQIFSQLTGLNLGEKIGIETLSLLICHPEGLFKGTPPDCSRHLFINKAEDSNTQKIAEELAFQVLRVCHKRINNIIIGAAIREETVAELIMEQKTL